jgi:hypothetical protein
MKTCRLPYKETQHGTAPTRSIQTHYYLTCIPLRRLGCYSQVVEDTPACTAKHSTAQHSTQHSTTQHSTAQHSTAQHSTAQHSTAQHSANDFRTYIRITCATYMHRAVITN